MRPIERVVMAPFRSRKAGYALLGFCGVSFLVLASLVIWNESFLLQADRPIRDWVVERRVPWLDDLMIGISFLGSRWVIGPLVSILAIWLLATGRCRVIAMVMLVAAVLNPILEVTMKEVIVQRARPDVLRLVEGTGAAFPSGHVLASVGFYGMLPVLVSKATRSFGLRAGAFASALVVNLAVGFSRMYLGIHWFTDVIGGYLLAAIVVLGTYEALGGHRLDETTCGPSRPFGIGQRSRAPSSLAR